MSRNLNARIAVAAVAIPAILWISYRGGLWLFGMVSLFAMIGILEYLWAEGWRPHHLLFWAAVITVAGVLFFMCQGGAIADHLDPTSWYASVVGVFLPVFFAITALYSSVGRRSPKTMFESHTRLVWGVCYIAFLYPLVYLLGETGSGMGEGVPSGGDSLLFLFAVLWVGDTAAMWVGKTWGRRKLAPTVSPNKTVEGFFGGLLGALAVGVLMIFWRLSGVPWQHVLVLALGCSFFGQIGDLAESLWKRSLGVKDSSAIIPGHGGVLDRFDSLLFAAPFMYFYFRVIGLT
ncbi:MAG: phosphatidate cytidylyltransferase [Candidatus Zixiibacteriota bacterium]